MPETPEFEPGDIIDVTLKGARVDKVDGRWLGCLLRAYRVLIPLDAPGITVVRTAPAEWPPLLGDLWRDRLGSVWFALGRHVLMVPGDPVGDLGGYEPGKVLAKVGPLTLVHREGASS